MFKYFVILLLVSFFTVSSFAGIDTVYHQKGEQKELQIYKDGEKHGRWLNLNESGDTLSIANFKNGKKHGEWIINDKEGNTVYVILYERGHKKKGYEYVDGVLEKVVVY